MIQLFHDTASECSRVVTKKYSTSFCSAISLLHIDLREPIFNIYGFVRIADEIVDSFHEHDKGRLLEQFKKETFESIERGISLNPVLHSFQRTVNQYDIDHELIHAFFKSMEWDLSKTTYDATGYKEYVYGSAEAVGLMCLNIFCEGDQDLMNALTKSARALGAAFQKVNFLRDFQADYTGLSRIYFPTCDFSNFTEEDKRQIELDIFADFKAAYDGILQLPLKARFGVYVAYKYYFSLFKKIRKLEAQKVLNQRIRIADYHKMYIVFRASIKNQLRLI